MPHYEYECSVCKHRFELLQKFSDEPAKVCVQCGGPVLRLLSSPAIRFKGTGWYVTDYGGKGGARTETKQEEKGDGAGEKPEKSPSASEETKTSKEPSGTPTVKPAKD